MPGSSEGGGRDGTDRERRDSRGHPTFTGDRECVLSRNRPDRPGVQVTRPQGRGWGAGRKTYSEIDALSASPAQPAPGAPASPSPVLSGPAAAFQVGDGKVLLWQN